MTDSDIDVAYEQAFAEVYWEGTDSEEACRAGFKEGIEWAEKKLEERIKKLETFLMKVRLQTVSVPYMYEIDELLKNEKQN